ncbi:class I SAM-dependent methyltransferase [Clostridium estertheticum]|uniref:class I SAM-dependent methyltransferase n=1 Tax=Clostridium estertheticum TaxID=238834 RepID=UPI001CF20DBB|nr:methyltransferase domain-containing protein [Clostridium estertheticum]MCB2309246.1 class I SAM-dependent methyltransferase [Clostridium estertheticum]MCB2346889.1 class I SAM-dependent methyltransferase [Clostridium estertheticum]MCB2352243.1 class I SAM-dependent methyltransferase [Clostridium estertheticum]WAG48552.1 class I SAM-dependent methyltransferase [Clostridium estertheticum]
MKDKRICPQCSAKSRSDYTRFFINKFINEVNLNNKIIDLGCGKARNIYYLNKIGFENITAIDINKFKEVDLNKFSFIQSDLNSGIPLKNKYNIIMCNFLLMFISDKEKLINEITRISEDNAFCIVELNKKKLSNGIQYDFKEIINLFSKEWDIVNLRFKTNKFIAKKRSI